MVVAELVLRLGAARQLRLARAERPLLVDAIAKGRQARRVDGPACRRRRCRSVERTSAGELLARERRGSRLRHRGGDERQEHAGQDASRAARAPSRPAAYIGAARIGSAGEEADRHDRARRPPLGPRRVVAAAGRRRGARRAHRGGLALALDAPRPAQHRRQPAPRPLPRRRPALELPHRQGRVQHAGRGRGRDRLRRARPTPGSTPSAAAAGRAGASRPARSSTPPGVLGSGTVTFGSGDEHIYRLRTDRAPA